MEAEASNVRENPFLTEGTNDSWGSVPFGKPNSHPDDIKRRQETAILLTEAAIYGTPEQLEQIESVGDVRVMVEVALDAKIPPERLTTRETLFAAAAIWGYSPVEQL